MRGTTLLVAGLLLPLSTFAAPSPHDLRVRTTAPKPYYKKLPRPYKARPRIRSAADNSTSQSQERADAVKDAFRTAWEGYYQYAFPHDILLPLTNAGEDILGGWGASAVDALSTASIMRLPDIVQQITDYIPSIDYSRSTPANESISLFETTIRHLGGLLAGYDLLSGPLADAGLVSDKSKVDSLLEQAQNLANNLKYAFNTPTGIPHNALFLANKSDDGTTDNGLATVGTLVLEWTHLSDLTGNDEYAELSQKAESYLLAPQPPSSEPWPGLLGTNINITTGEFEDALGGWSGGDDSFYEYLIKMYVYDTSRFEQYKDRWTIAADSSIAHLASHPSSRPDLTFMAAFNGTELILESEHLTCFDGGNFLLGGSILNRDDYINFGIDLVDGCHATYISTATGIGPEIFSWNETETPANQTAFYQKAGFWIINGAYILRPEVIESYYYAYRITHDAKYQDWAWDAFQNVIRVTRGGSGFSDIDDVNSPDGGTKLNAQESFWFAEVLKYSYLIHANDEEWQVSHEGKNGWVFNTEAHPIKVAGTPI